MKRASVTALAMLAVVAVLAVRPRTAHADEGSSYRAVIDRVELEPASITGQRLRVYLSALAVGGQLIDLSDPKSIKLYIGSSQRTYAYALGSYNATNTTTAIIVLVQATSDFSDALQMISGALDQSLVQKLDDKTDKIALVPYGDSVSSPKLVAPHTLKGKVSLTTDGSTGDPVLSDAVDRALIALKKSDATRKLIIIVGDGRDIAGDHDRVTRTAERAAKLGVRIHTIAYSPADLRRPLLVLGELSKRSLGTLRWPGQGRHPTTDSWTDAFAQLSNEIEKQHVLTFFAPAEEELAGQKLHIVTVGRTETTSNELKIPELAQPLAQTGGGGGGGHALHWVFVIGGLLVGAVLVLGLIGFVLANRRPAQRMPMPGMVPGAVPGMVPGAPPAAMPGMVPGMVPGMMPAGRPVPMLMIMNGQRTGERMMLRHGFWIGKQQGCDLLIQDGYTSSQHAQFGMDAIGNWRLYDRNSTNGTFVNGQRVTEIQLEHGVVIRIGSTELRFLTQ